MGRGPLPMEVGKGVYINVFVGAIQGSRLHSRTCAADCRRRRSRIKEYTNRMLHPSRHRSHGENVKRLKRDLVREPAFP